MLDHRLLVNPPGGGVVTVKGSNLVEQQTQADATGGVLTFGGNFEYASIYNTDAINAGVFTINGVAVNVPAGEPTERFGVGGTPGATVTVSGAATYIVSRWT